jgi:diguanylate cyclase (GGDEF)-like protein
VTGRDHTIRKDLMRALHNESVEHINKGGAVISAGLSDYRPGEDQSYHSVFERADELMYEEKQLLKGLGAVTRDDSDEEAKLKAAVDGEPTIINVKKQLLIVEDEAVNREMLGNFLGEDYEVLYAADGLDAMELIRDKKQDIGLMLLDLQMPRMDGMEVLRAVKGDPELSRIPVIVLTADQKAEVECLKLGAMDFIPKPYPDWEIVQARVNRCIELSENRNIIQSTERDALTRLFNIDYFLRYVRIYDQHYEDMPMDAIVVDINGFHILNERYGKQYGDNVLKRLGERIRQIAREVGGVGCRSGADTFLIYCPHREDYQALLNRASEGLTEEETSGNRIRLRMGVYAEVDKALDIDRRFDYAKVASNTVKNGYRGAVGVYDTEMHEREVYKARLLEDFRRP